MKLLKLTVAFLAAALVAVPATVSAAGQLTIGLPGRRAGSGAGHGERRGTAHYRPGLRAIFY
jgi:hypothetical protein